MARAPSKTLARSTTKSRSPAKAPRKTATASARAGKRAAVGADASAGKGEQVYTSLDFLPNAPAMPHDCKWHVTSRFASDSARAMLVETRGDVGGLVDWLADVTGIPADALHAFQAASEAAAARSVTAPLDAVGIAAATEDADGSVTFTFSLKAAPSRVARARELARTYVPMLAAFLPSIVGVMGDEPAAPGDTTLGARS